LQEFQEKIAREAPNGVPLLPTTVPAEPVTTSVDNGIQGSKKKQRMQ